MKLRATLTVLLAAAALAGCWEALWRLDHPRGDHAVASPDGRYIAQDRSLPEGSQLPYADGIHVRRAGVPLWATSDLVFAAHCKPVERLVWITPTQLHIRCRAAAHTALTFPSSAGITVVHDGGVASTRQGPP